VLDFQQHEPLFLFRTGQFLLRPFGEVSLVPGMAPLDRFKLASIGQPLQPEFADRLQHRETGFAPLVFPLPDEALVDQRRQPVQAVDFGSAVLFNERIRSLGCQCLEMSSWWSASRSL
jgi:hypothetical protein